MTQVQAIVGGGNAATTGPLTISASAANTALSYALWLSSSTAPTALVDSAGGSLVGGQWVLRQSTGAWFIYDRLSNPGGITSVTPTFGSTNWGGHLCEDDDFVSFDKTGYNDSGGAVSSWASASTGTLSFANEVCRGFAATFTGTSQSPAPSGSWAAGTGTGITSGSWVAGGNQFFVERQVVTATTALQATGTWGVASYTYSAIVTYRQTTGGGGGSGAGPIYRKSNHLRRSGH